MKKVLSFSLAVALAFTFLFGFAFASSEPALVVGSDSFISWGGAFDKTFLSAPASAVNDRNFIVYRVWQSGLFRYVIDSFDPSVVPVEGGSYSFDRYYGSSHVLETDALIPSSYTVFSYVDSPYLISTDISSLPVYSNFDYCDADGNLIASKEGYVGSADLLVDLTLYDGSVVQVPRYLQSQYFVLARSDSGEYAIWLFKSSDVEAGLVHEGASGFTYSISYGGLSVASVSVSGVTVDLTQSAIDFTQYPCVFVYSYNSASVSVIATVLPGSVSYSSNRYNFRAAHYATETFNVGTGAWSNFRSGNNFGTLNISPNDPTHYAANYDLIFSDGSVYFPQSFSLAGGLSWSSWNTMSTSLDITSYGDIVYQSFDFPLEPPSDVPPVVDDSEQGFFEWIKAQIVFISGQLKALVDSVLQLKDGSFAGLDIDQSKVVLAGFFDNIFNGRVSVEHIRDLGSVLDGVSDWFNTGHGIGSLFEIFEQEGFNGWFTEETRLALDSVGSD